MMASRRELIPRGLDAMSAFVMLNIIALECERALWREPVLTRLRRRSANAAEDRENSTSLLPAAHVD